MNKKIETSNSENVETKCFDYFRIFLLPTKTIQQIQRELAKCIFWTKKEVFGPSSSGECTRNQTSQSRYEVMQCGIAVKGIPDVI